MARRLPPIICIPDTTALVHLRYVNIVGRSACLWLWDEFEVKVGQKIPEEVHAMAARNARRAPGEIGGLLNRSVLALDIELNRMEKGFLHPLGFQLNDSDDLGERLNCQIALQLLAQNS